VIASIWRGVIAAGAVLVVVAAAAPTPALSHPSGRLLTLDVLSSAPHRVTGGDALIRVRVGGRDDPGRVRVRVGGTDVTAAFTVDPGRRELVGVVSGLPTGTVTVTATLGHRARTDLRLRNHPVAGPVFAGPKQYPFLCRTEQAGLGQPLVDNDSGQGMRVYALNPDGTKGTTVVGWSRDCAAPTVVDYLYRATDNRFRPLPADGSRPDDLVTTTTLDGRTVDYVVRRERGTIDRFLYSIAMLAPLAEAAAGTGRTDPDDSAWNGRAVFWFDGGVAIGHDQGRIPGGALYHDALARGYAVLGSSGNDTSTHYNLVLAGENALMVKEHFIESHGVPRATIGIGGSGGAIQQYVFGQNHGRAIIDGAIAAYSYPDMVTQTIHVSDCELLEYYMDVTDAANPAWRDWTNRRRLEGLNSSATVPNPYRGNAPGSTECVNGWRGLTPLANNPLWTRLDPLWAQMDPPGVAQTVQWTHWGDLVNIYGVGPDGYARSTFDNVGVQYGLAALTAGQLSPAGFLDLNARVGTWKPAAQMVQEGCPFTPAACADPAQFDPWSSRNMLLSPDGGATPAPRTRGDRAAIAAAYRAGLVFTGDIDLPVIDWRHYLEERLDMHNSHQSFATRARMRAADGRADNQVIWFTDARPAPAVDQQPEALAVMDEWLANLRARPHRGVVGNRPALATDRCFRTDGTQIAAGPHVWDGILDHRAPGPCTTAFPLYGTSRTVAGGPLAGGVYACALQSVDRAIHRGLYGSWRPSAAERDRLRQIFPTGVCDYRRGDAARPR
jgi:hypothetical protein